MMVLHSRKPNNYLLYCLILI